MTPELVIVVMTEMEGLALLEGEHCSHSPHAVFQISRCMLWETRSTLLADIPPQKQQGGTDYYAD